MAIMSAFQAEDVGSIPITRSMEKFLTQLRIFSFSEIVMGIERAREIWPCARIFSLVLLPLQ